MTELDRSQKEIRKAARDFARGEFDRDLALEMENDGRFPGKIWAKAGELGFLGLHFPEQYGGSGLGWLETVLVTEAFCRQDATIGCALMFSGYAAECLWRFGDDTLKETYLPEVAEARCCSTAAFNEPGVRCDYTAMQTSARRAGGHWVVNGVKTYVLNGRHADIFVVLCRTDESRSSMLLVEGDSNGLTRTDLGKRLGTNMNGTVRLELADVQVPAGHLVGRQGDGAQQLEAFFNDAAVLLAAAAAGIAAGAFDRALAYVKERAAFGRKIAVFEVIRQKIAQMAAHVETARAVTYQAARAHTSGNAGSLPAIAKLAAARAAVEVSSEAIQLLGGYGYMKEYEVERFYRDAKALELMLGGPGAMKKRIADNAISRLK